MSLDDAPYGDNIKTIEATYYAAITSMLAPIGPKTAIKILKWCLNYFERVDG